MKLLPPSIWRLACLCLCILLVPVSYAQDAADEERLLKAAFIFNFAKYTRWPEGTLEEGDGWLNLCTSGQDELIPEIKRLGGRVVQGQILSIKELQGKPDPGDCHILYIAMSEQRSYQKIIESTQGIPLLTISELPRFARSGGIIKLYRDKERVRFTINLDVVREAGLSLSSRLLNLADVIDGEGEQ